jgi:fumarylacetoacetase
MTLQIDETHNPATHSWVDGADAHVEFPVQNLPLGVFSAATGVPPRIGVAIADRILDLQAIAPLLPTGVRDATGQPLLNHVFALPAQDRRALRRRLFELLTQESHRAIVEPALHDAAACILHLPAAIGDYTDFYVGIHHATNVGKLFRPDNPLLPNYKYVPIGYHGRASSVRVSGIPVTRPRGQYKAPDRPAPEFGPSTRLDYELELGVWIASGNPLGEPLPIDRAGDAIAGLCLLNDWSARDFQAWEYQPLGPFLAKNFQTTVSPWVVTAEALVPFRVAQPSRPEGDPAPLPYLSDPADQAAGAFSIELEVTLTTARMREHNLAPHRLSKGPATNMYWTVAQIVTHHASNGCNLNPGDLLGTGTISAPSPEGFGSLLEISQGGARAVELSNGERRTFLEDGDEVLMTARAVAEGRVPIGFGECRAMIQPAG